MNRRNFIRNSALIGAVASVQNIASVKGNIVKKKIHIEENVYKNVFDKTLLIEPVIIDSIKLIKNGKVYIVIVRSKDGAEGYAVSHPKFMETLWPVFLTYVVPPFIGKDAREIENLLTDVYLFDSNYKKQGLLFWVPVASLEFAILDLLGKVVNKSIGDFFGSVLQKEIDVYRASEKRGNIPEEEIAYLKRITEPIGAKALKFRLGARMRYNDQSTNRDLALIPLVRKTFGDDFTIYADANGSYDVPMSLKIGKVMEEYKYSFFEEPCPFDYYEETKEIADKLEIKIAGGEEESSLRMFKWMIEHDVVQTVQPDLLYFGGLIRSVKVARMAQAAGINCTPHMSGNGLGYLYVLHFASFIPNCGPHQEFKGDNDKVPFVCSTSSLKAINGKITVPTGPGLGIEIDPDFISSAKEVKL
ncbi:MAG: mandelate racemase/muconate lactonizing enzyme family protein [Melioribacteraceae bacterium]|nr:mandelate racemase/muconate lactonizing enzyme family protein [Melioribacteraceae bacterium]